MAAKIVIIEGVEVVAAAAVDTKMTVDVEGGRAAIAIVMTVLVGYLLHQSDTVEDRLVTRLQLHLLWLQSVLSFFRLV